MKYRALLAFVIVIALSGCAYNYAGKEGKTRQEPMAKQDAQVVTFEKKQPKPKSSCGTPTFRVHYYAASGASTKTIDCESREVVSVERAPLADQTYQDRKVSGLPEDKWYIEVDPKGLRAAFLNNDQLLKMSRLFKIEFFGKDEGRDVLIYLFLDRI